MKEIHAVCLCLCKHNSSKITGDSPFKSERVSVNNIELELIMFSLY